MIDLNNIENSFLTYMYRPIHCVITYNNLIVPYPRMFTNVTHISLIYGFGSL